MEEGDDPSQGERQRAEPDPDIDPDQDEGEDEGDDRLGGERLGDGGAEDLDAGRGTAVGQRGGGQVPFALTDLGGPALGVVEKAHDGVSDQYPLRRVARLDLLDR